VADDVRAERLPEVLPEEERSVLRLRLALAQPARHSVLGRSAIRCAARAVQHHLRRVAPKALAEAAEWLQANCSRRAAIASRPRVASKALVDVAERQMPEAIVWHPKAAETQRALAAERLRAGLPWRAIASRPRVAAAQELARLSAAAAAQARRLVPPGPLAVQAASVPAGEMVLLRAAPGAAAEVLVEAPRAAALAPEMSVGPAAARQRAAAWPQAAALPSAAAWPQVGALPSAAPSPSAFLRDRLRPPAWPAR
jgi:hypothetical protein